MPETKVRWCSRGDTISTVRPLSDGDYCHAVIPSGPSGAEACAEANELIATGRWRVSVCGQCFDPVERCNCK